MTRRLLCLRDFNHLPLEDDVPIRDLGINRHDRIYSCSKLDGNPRERVAHSDCMRFCAGYPAHRTSKST